MYLHENDFGGENAHWKVTLSHPVSPLWESADIYAHTLTTFVLFSMRVLRPSWIWFGAASLVKD